MIPSLWNLLKLPGCCCHYLLFCQVLSPHEREKLSSPTFFSYTKEFTSLDGGNFYITWSYGLNLLHHGREFCCVRRELSSFFFTCYKLEPGRLALVVESWAPGLSAALSRHSRKDYTLNFDAVSVRDNIQFLACETKQDQRSRLTISATKNRQEN